MARRGFVDGVGVTGFKSKLSLDTSKPDGTMRKLIDVSRLADIGLQDDEDWFLKQGSVRS